MAAATIFFTAMFAVIAAVLELRNATFPLVAITGTLLSVGLIAFDAVRSMQRIRRTSGLRVPSFVTPALTSATAIGGASLVLIVMSILAREFDEIMSIGVSGSCGAIVAMIGLRLWLAPAQSTAGQIIRVAGTAAMIGLLTLFTILTFEVIDGGLEYGNTWTEGSYLILPGFALLIIASLSVVIFELRVFAARRRPDVQETWDALQPIETDCPACRHRFTGRHGTMRCPACRVAFVLRFDEERCVCNQLLYRMPGSTCPECGRPRQGLSEQAASVHEPVARTEVGERESNASKGEP